MPFDTNSIMSDIIKRLHLNAVFNRTAVVSFDLYGGKVKVAFIVRNFIKDDQSYSLISIVPKDGTLPKEIICGMIVGSFNTGQYKWALIPEFKVLIKLLGYDLKNAPGVKSFAEKLIAYNRTNFNERIKVLYNLTA